MKQYPVIETQSVIGTPVGRDKIRVLYLEYAIAWGGSGKSLIELIDAQENVEATILTRIPFPDSVLDGTKVRYEMARIPRWVSRFPSYIREVMEDAYWIYAIVRIAKSSRADILHLNNGISYNFASMIAARLLNIPFVVHQRGWEKPRRRLSLARRLLGRFPVLAISEAVERHLHSSIDSDLNVRAIYDVVKHPSMVNRQTPKNGVITIGMHGMLTPWKGQLLLVEAAAYLRTHHHLKLRYKIAGAPVAGAEQYAADLRAAIEAADLCEQFELVGLVEDVYGFLETLDISVHASLAPEPLGRVIVEAQLAGVPVIASGEAGALELLVDGAGVSFRPGDALALAECIRDLVLNTEKRHQMAISALTSSRIRFDERRLALAVRGVYESLVISNRPA